jgi:hypothetical protein
MEGMQKTSEGKTSFLLMCANPRARTQLHRRRMTRTRSESRIVKIGGSAVPSYIVDTRAPRFALNVPFVTLPHSPVNDEP